MRPTSNPPTGPLPSPSLPPVPVPAGPEAALRLAAAGGPPPGWREWPDEVPVPAVRVALSAAELARDPGALARARRDETLYQAVRGLDVDALARHATVLLDGLAEAEGEARDGLIGLLETVADRPTVGERVVRAVRALPARRPGSRSVLPLLRAAGAVLVRADLDRVLPATALDPDPKRAGTALLRETFGIAGPAVPSAWQRELAAATGDVRALAAHRSRGAAPGSRELLAALADVHADAPPDVQAALVDWMTDLQPLGAPPWTLAEDARAGAAAPRAVHPADLDQPRSAAQRERLLALLASGTPRQRNTAADALLSWPEPEARASRTPPNAVRPRSAPCASARPCPRGPPPPRTRSRPPSCGRPSPRGSGAPWPGSRRAPSCSIRRVWRSWYGSC
ncbi:hypothetical protein [Streptomyces sp. NPDC085466]|uniref:hypothetical protein n=1 Tax=Streptomyces sp. NPDC085466 TaxID=3365725 RepID=UPI0037D9476A